MQQNASRALAFVGLIACSVCGAAEAQAVAEEPPPAEPAPVQTASDAPARACFPACRAGYFCHEGQCISECNPECGAGEVCRAGRVCETVAAPAPLPPERHDAAVIAEHEAELARASAYRHDGFYLRLGFTIGYAIDRAERDGIETTSSGFGGFIDYAIGGSPIEGLVLAFAQHTLGVFEPDTEIDGVPLDDDHLALYQLLGLMIDAYPDATRGLHGAVTLGFGAADILHLDYDDSLGFGLGLTAGYDFWFAEQWSFGVAGQLFYITGADDEFGDHEAVVPMVALSALLH